MDAQEVGRRVKMFREKKKLCKNALANQAGISPNYINDIENGRKCPTVEFLSYICDALGISLQKFFSENLEKEPITVDTLTEIQKQRLNDFLESL